MGGIGYFNETDNNIAHYEVHMTVMCVMALRKSMSLGDGDRNLVESTAAEPLE